MKDNAETRDGILIVLLDAHPKPIAWDGRHVCRENRDECCGWPPISGLRRLCKSGFVKHRRDGSWALTPEGIRHATLVWNRYAQKEGKKHLIRDVPKAKQLKEP